MQIMSSANIMEVGQMKCFHVVMDVKGCEEDIVCQINMRKDHL